MAVPVLVEDIIEGAVDGCVAAGKGAVAGVGGRDCGGVYGWWVYGHHTILRVWGLVSSALLVF